MAGQDAGEHEDYEDDAEEVVVRDPDSGKTIECYVDQQVIEPDGRCLRLGGLMEVKEVHALVQIDRSMGRSIPCRSGLMLFSMHTCSR